jgi:DNA-directed RNA polymerase subunit RPC12/RpoP
MRTFVKFMCFECGQKILVEKTISRTGVTCPSCQKQLSVHPNYARTLLEIVGAVVVLFVGVSLGIGLTAPNRNEVGVHSQMPEFKGDKTGQPTREDYERAAQWLLDRDKEP